MQTLIVTAQDLKNASQTVADYAAQYQTAYRALIQAADDISAEWQGEDFTAFQNKVHALEDDFKTMYDLLMGCSNDLSESAQGYIDTQSTNTANANTLIDSF